MNLIAQRPATWSDVVGQQRPIDLLQAVLKNDKYLTRGLILYGILGVGKTTTAYLLAKALMCKGSNHLGCGECPSCVTIQTDGIDKHPDFIEIDGAVRSGVEAARETVEITLSLPVLGRRRVTIVDEAHFLSPEAWGAYLKTLESGDTESVFIFVTTEVTKIQPNIRSRCIRIPFERVNLDVLIGHLANVATTNNIAYELDALKLIARQSRGIVRDAVQYLDTCGALGVMVDTKVVRTVIDTSLEDACERLLYAVAAKDQVIALQIADDLVRRELPSKAADRMLGIYARSIYTEDPELGKIYVGLPDVGRVAEVLAKWSAIQNAPADVITIIVYELLRTQAPNAPLRAIVTPSGTRSAAAPAPAKRSPLAALLDDEAV
jgi:DNA polymerase III subunit gamma/tau